MNSVVRSTAVMLCGLVTSIVTSILVVIVSRMMDMDIYTFTAWGIIPVGALFTGAFAASGYYFGCIYLNKRPDTPLLLEMLVAAAFCQVLIYYLGYETLVLSDGRHVTDVVSFGGYLTVLLTKSHLQVTYSSSETDELGSMGYVLAGLYFLGFLIGGLCVWAALRAKPFCSSCDVYFRKLFKRTRSFADSAGASAYYDKVFTHAFDSAEFASMIRSNQVVSKPGKGAVQIQTFLHSCPKCDAQVVEEKVEVHNGKSWTESTKLARTVPVPSGINLRAAFR
jgi:hypothetical protein